MLNITTMRLLSIVLFACLLFSPPADAQTSSRIEETEITLVGAWDTEFDGEYSEGRAVLANFSAHDPGAYASFEFEGTGITWIGARTFNGGLFDWIIDEGTAGERSGTVSTYIDGVERFSTEVLVTDLALGVHTFKFLSLGVHGDSMLSTIPSETYIDAFDVLVNNDAPTVTVVAASSTYPAGTDNDGFVSMTDDPLGPFSGESVTFHGTGAGGVPQVYKYQIDFDQEVTLDSIVVEGAAWRGDSISLSDDLDNEIKTVQVDGENNFRSHVLDVSGTTGRRFFLEEINTDSSWRYRSNIEIRLEGSAPTNTTEVSIRALIDGRSQIKIQDNQLWWHHFDNSAPGLHNGANEPTIVNGFDWLPVWPFNDEGSGCDCESDILDLSIVGIQLANDVELLELRVVSARDSALLLQSPTAGNDFLSIIEFDDPSGGSVWYDVVAVFGSNVPIIVPGTSNPWLAGMPAGSTAAGGDVAPDQSPVLAPIAITPGVASSFSATGLVSNCNCNLVGPDGVISQYMPHSMENGMPDTNMPLNALAGVFLGPEQPDLSQSPPGLDFGAGGNVADGINYTDLSPGLKQVFFIGDGLTDTGVPQQITPPAGATRLYLGTNDLEGWFDNIGEFEVEVSGGVPPINDIPIAVNDNADANTGVSVIIDVLENDQNIADTPIVVSIAADPVNGTAIAGADNMVTYTSVAGFVGDDDFQYTVTDMDGDASSATVTVAVVDPNTNVLPIANDDSADVWVEFSFGGNVVIDVLANDQGLDDVPVNVEILSYPGVGSVVVLTNNRISYTTYDTLNNEDSFEYRVTDANGDWASARVTVAIQASTVDDGTRSNANKKKGGGATDLLWLLMLLLLILRSNTLGLRARYH